MSNIPTAEEVAKTADYRGKVAIVTGGNSGIGKETARVLALHNAHVILAVRSVESGNKAKADILDSIGKDKAGLIEVEHLDLSSQASIRDFATRFSKREKKDLHFLVNNAGLISKKRETTAEGLESTIGANHVGTFLLTILLLPFLKASAPARIVVVASAVHLGLPAPDLSDFNLSKDEPFDPLKAYGISKLYNVLFANELGRRLSGTGVSVNSLHPGLIVTNIFKGSPEQNQEKVDHFAEAYNTPIISTEQGAATTIYLLTSEAGTKSGGYYHGTELSPQSPVAQDEQFAKALWEHTEKLTHVSFGGF